MSLPVGSWVVGEVVGGYGQCELLPPLLGAVGPTGRIVGGWAPVVGRSGVSRLWIKLVSGTARLVVPLGIWVSRPKEGSNLGSIDKVAALSLRRGWGRGSSRGEA